MANTDQLLQNNQRYARGEATHRATHPGSQPIQPSRRVAVIACMDARIDVEDLLGLQTGEAHIIRNAGGVVSEDAIRCLIISHHLLNTNEVILIHHTRCGMLAFTDDLLRTGLEGDAAAAELLSKATGRTFTSPAKASASPLAFHAFSRPTRTTRCGTQPLEQRAAAVGRAPGNLRDRAPSLAAHHRSRRDHRARFRLRRRHREARGSRLPGPDGLLRLTRQRSAAIPSSGQSVDPDTSTG